MPRRVSMRCAFEAATPPRPRVDLLLALPRPKVLRRLWSQLAALGVGQVILTNAARVERDYFGTHVLAPATYAPLLHRGPAAGARHAAAVGVGPSPVQGAGRGRAGRAVSRRRAGGRAAGARAEPFGAAWSEARQPTRCCWRSGPKAAGPDSSWRFSSGTASSTAGIGPRTLRSDTATIALLTLAHQALRLEMPARPTTNASTTNDADDATG